MIIIKRFVSKLGIKELQKQNHGFEIKGKRNYEIEKKTHSHFTKHDSATQLNNTTMQ